MERLILTVATDVGDSRQFQILVPDMLGMSRKLRDEKVWSQIDEEVMKALREFQVSRQPESADDGKEG